MTSRRITLYMVAACLLTACLGTAWAQVPEVKSVDRVRGAMADKVTLRGSGFGTNGSRLAVQFGGARAQVLSVTNQLLEVAVPSGTTYQTISVAHLDNLTTGYSIAPFLLSFSGNHPFDPARITGPTNFSAEQGVYDVCACDFDGDFKVDMAAANLNNTNLSLFLNTSSGAGNVAFSKKSFALGAFSIYATCGDLDSDGKPDLVVSQGGTATTRERLFILRNTSTAGNINFSVQSVAFANRKNARIQIADLDLNGKPEVIVTDEGSGTVTVLVNESTAGAIVFNATPLTITLPTEVASTDALDVLDVNGDNRPEIVTSKYQTLTSDLFIIQNNSLPGAVAMGAVTKVAVDQSVKSVRLGDLDGDGKADVAVTRSLGANVSVMRNTGTGTAISFAAPVVVATEASPLGLDFGDMDGDGKTDIVVASALIPKITVLNNESTPGNLSFTKHTFNAPFDYRNVRVFDADYDGKPDIAVNRFTANAVEISVFRNSTCVLPVITPAKTPLALCSGALPYQLTATASRGAFFQWLKDGVPLACGVNQNTFDVTTATGSGRYTVKIFSEGSTCAVNTGCALESDGIDITVAAGTAANSNPTNNGPVCIGSALNLSVANPIGGATYTWSGPNGFTATGATQSIANFQLAHAGTYNVDVTVGGCIAKRESTLVEAIDVPSFAVGVPGSPVLCAGDPVKTLSVVPAPGTFTYQWLKDGSAVGTGPTFNVTSVPASSGSYKVRASYAGCTTIESPAVDIDVAALPVAQFSASATACANQKVAYTNNSTSDAGATPQYQWNFDDGKSSTEKDPEHIFTAAGTYDVTLTVSYAGGACPDTETKQITVTPAPPVAITNPTNTYTLCEGAPLTLEVVGAFTSYAWSTGATSASIEVTTGGTYTVDVVSGSCTLTATRTVTAIAAPGVIVTATPDQIDEGQTSQLQASGLDNYQWTPAETLSDADIANPIATPLLTTTYQVTGTDASGCTGTATVTVKVTGEVIVNKLEPSNFFSPNNVEPNELWVVKDIELYPQCGVVIYDDKGVKVFEAKPYVNDWNGTYNGKAVPDGVYFYIIRCDGEESTPRTGSITLIR